jgi:MFS transporter, DHA3 family, macrolide efflux protein
VRLLRQPRLALLFAGGALNSIGSWATLIALWGFAAYHFHAGPDQVALLGLAWTAPGAALSLFSGLPIDRFGPRVTIIAANLLGVVTALAMAAASSYSTLVLLALAAGVVQAFGCPAATSLPPRLVDDADLLAANSVMGVAEQSAIVFGPLAGSLAINWWGIQAAFLFDAATFVAGTLAVLPLRLRPLAKETGVPVGCRDLLAGLRLAQRTTDIRRTLLLAAAVFCSWGAFVVIEPLYVRNVLHRSPATLGLLQTVFGIGLIGTTALLPRIGDRVATVRALAASVVVSGLAAALYVGTRSLLVAMLGVFVWGVDVAFFMAPMQTLLQRSAPPEAHGRVMALAGAVNGAGGLVAIPLAGVAAGAIGVSATGVVAGILASLAGAGGLAVTARQPAPARAPAPARRPLAGFVAEAG